MPDVPTAAGPLAGILAAMRWNPDVSWLVTACDMPHITVPALKWLLDQRSPGVWAVFPKTKDQRVQPLFSFYDFRMRPLLEAAAQKQRFPLIDLCLHKKVITPAPPKAIMKAWENVNDRDDLRSLKNIRPYLD